MSGRRSSWRWWKKQQLSLWVPPLQSALKEAVLTPLVATWLPSPSFQKVSPPPKVLQRMAVELVPDSAVQVVYPCLDLCHSYTASVLPKVRTCSTLLSLTKLDAWDKLLES